MNKLHLPTILTLVLILLMLAYGPIAQFADYHAFADQSHLLGIPHTADVLSNIGFALVGIIGLVLLWRRSDHPSIERAWPGTLLFLSALILTAIGSSWYHLAPDNTRLIFDRLPIALACAGLLSAVRSELITKSVPWMTTLALAGAAIVSVGWWVVTGHYQWLSEHGDLRPYLLLQILPLLLIPLWQWIYRAPTEERVAYGVAIACYLLAKGFELADHQVLQLTGWLTGHTVKHLLATIGAAVLVTHLLARTGRPIAVVNRPGLPQGGALIFGQTDRTQ